jgi:NADH-quinone oxidoreductase subunit N
MTISTPILWVLLPLGISILAILLNHQSRISGILTAITAFGLSILAVYFPENMEFTLGPVELVFEESLAILGRQIQIRQTMLPFIALIFAATGLWSLGGGISGTPSTFRPISLAITALLTAALGVQPFLYAALLIQTAVLVSIPMLSVESQKENKGTIRYLVFQTLALPFILLAGWLLTGVETLPPDSSLVQQSMLMLGLGFAFLLGIFPFHSWIPMLSQESHPKAVSYLLFFIPTTVLVFGLNFINRYAFIRNAVEFYQTLRVIGTIMILIGGIWTAFQSKLKRAMGFTIISETGISLLSIGLYSQGGLNWLFLLLPLRALSLWLWSHALSLIENHVGLLDLQNMRGFARQYPLLAGGLVMAQFSIAGLPLLASFPIKFSILSSIMVIDQSIGVWAFIGSLGLFIFTLRLIASMTALSNNNLSENWSIQEQKHEYIPIILISLALITLGLFPNAFPSRVVNTLTSFLQLQ